jgi:hypothetical protein
VSEGAAREQARIDGTNLDDETDTEPESFESLLERMKSEEARTKSGEVRVDGGVEVAREKAPATVEVH